MSETIEKLSAIRVDWITGQFRRWPWDKPAGYFAECFAAQEKGEIVLFLARIDEELRGYLKIVWMPGYPPFREKGIPEIQDLNVAPESRRKGVATRLMDVTERSIAERGSVAGIGFGLHPGYAAAQRMYVLRGYVPDAMPVTYQDRFVVQGQTVILDDELVLHLSKELR